jgi:Right handed beta helix region
MKLLAILFFFALLTGIAAGAEQTVSPTGGHSDQKVINGAIDTVAMSGGGTVYLSTGTYYVDGPVMLKSNIKLTGDSSAVIKVYSGSSQWFQGSIGIISNAENLHNTEVCGFQVDGSVTALPPGYHQSRSDTAHDCERCILFAGDSGNQMSNISIYNMTLFDSFSDGVYIRFVDNVHIYNNFISNTQHEGIYLVCCRYSLVENNRIAGITSDCMRFDNNQNTEVRGNICWSYNGSHASNTYIHGENGIQVGNTGASHGYDGRNKPFFTQNVYVHDNSFINNGLNAILIDGDVKDDNVYFKNNIVIGHEQLETSGFPIELIGNYSYEHPPSLQTSEKVFSSIFDVLNMTFYDSAITNQSDDSIQYTVQKTTIGNIAGGVKVIGFRNQAVIDNRTYMQDNNSTIVKSEAVLAPSTLDFWNKGVDKIDKDIHIEVKNGTATATMIVNMRVYSVSYNQATKKTTKTYRSYSANFNDTAKAPEIFPAPQNIKGEIEVYPTFFEVYVPADGLVKLDFTYGANVSTHSFLVGEREQKDNVQYTEYTRLEDWSGDLNHTGQWCFVYGTFDESKLNVKATTPYQEVNVTDFNITRHDYPKEPIAFWFYPTVGFLICLYFIGKFFWRKIWY